MRLRTRLSLLSLLGVVLAVLLVWRGTLGPDPSVGAFPQTGRVLDTPGQYVGQRVLLTGTVVETDPVRIAMETNAGRSVVTVDGASGVEVGSRLRVFGRLRSRERITAIRTLAVPSSNLLYTYVVSACAGLWVLARLCNRWTVDQESRTLVTRDRPWITFDRIWARFGGEDA